MQQTIRQFKEMLDIKGSIYNRLRANRFMPYVMLAMVILVAACIHIWQRVHVIEVVKEVSQLTKEQTRLDDELKKVNSDIATLSMESRIEEYAMDTLGMIPVPADKLYTLVPDESYSYQKDDFRSMVEAIKRVAEYVPRPSENSALAGEPSMIKIDSADEVEESR